MMITAGVIMVTSILEGVDDNDDHRITDDVMVISIQDQR